MPRFVLASTCAVVAAHALRAGVSDTHTQEHAVAADIAHLADDACGPVRVDGSTLGFVDKCGRTRFFRGLNVVYKGYPWHPITDAHTFDPFLSFSDIDAALWQSLGLNVARLGVMWPGVEPVQGQINATYLQVMRNLTSTMARYGISSLVDMHQDSFAGVFCGEGVPNWAASQYAGNAAAFPSPIDSPYRINASTGEPSTADCNRHDWTTYYFTSALGASAQNMYTNANSSALGFYNYWYTLGRAFGSSDVSAAVLGFELMNEPWAGDVLSQPWLLVPGVADQEVLQPFFMNASSNVRRGELAGGSGDQHVVFVEGVTWDDFFPIGFSALPGAANGLGAISFHYYDLPNFDVSWQIDARKRDMRRLGAGGLLTEFEFGVLNLTGTSEQSSVVDVVTVQPCQTLPTHFAEMTTTMELCDENQIGYIGWEYKSFFPITGVNTGFFNSDGSIQMDKVTLLARTFPLAVAGAVQSFGFDQASATFSLTYTLNANASAPTVVFISDELVYPGGYNISVQSQPANAVTWTVQHFNATRTQSLPAGTPAPFAFSYLFVSNVPGAGVSPTNVTVNVAPSA